MRNRIIAFIFVIFITVTGFMTLRASAGEIAGLMREEMTTETISGVEKVVTQHFWHRNRWININGLFQKGVLKTADREKDWYKLSDGSYIYALNKLPEEALTEYADSVIDLSDAMEERGITFLYVALPFKVADDGMLPPGVTEYGNENMDFVLARLGEHRVNVFDLREPMAATGIPRNELYFPTDQHWKPETALWAAGQISEHLSGIAEWKHDPSRFDLANYDVKVYEDWFLGAIGKKVGNWYTGVDDFDLLTPKFETDYHFTADTAGGWIERNGSFKDSMIVKARLKKDYFNVNTYAAYTGGDYKLNIVDNLVKDVPNEKRVLLVRDSFSCALLPFFSTSTRQVTTIDLRHYTASSLIEYIDSQDFDIVIIAYNPSAFSPEQYTFF